MEQIHVQERPAQTAIIEVAVNAVEFGPPRRETRPVTDLAHSMARIGLLNPITVTPDNRLVAGWHRLHAAKALGWPTIPARVSDLGELDAELASIDENLIRNDLSVLEQAEHLKRREDILFALGQRAEVGWNGNQHVGGATVAPPTTTPDIADDVGLSERSVQNRLSIAKRIPDDIRDDIRATSIADSTTDLLALARMDEETQRQVVDEVLAGNGTTVKRIASELKREEKREHNRQMILDAPALEEVAQSGERFGAVVIDPPWDWGDEGDADQFGRARPDYATLPIEDIAKLPVGYFAENDAHLYLWITNRSLPKGFALLEEWGFRYVTMLTWVKATYGLGNYFRGQTEHVLFGVRGSLPLLRHDAGTCFMGARGEDHSSKPAEFYDLVETCSSGPWLEMFSRSERPGWKRWGEPL